LLGGTGVVEFWTGVSAAMNDFAAMPPTVLQSCERDIRPGHLTYLSHPLAVSLIQPFPDLRCTRSFPPQVRVLALHPTFWRARDRRRIGEEGLCRDVLAVQSCMSVGNQTDHGVQLPFNLDSYPQKMCSIVRYYCRACYCRACRGPPSSFPVLDKDFFLSQQ